MNVIEACKKSTQTKENNKAKHVFRASFALRVLCIKLFFLLLSPVILRAQIEPDSLFKQGKALAYAGKFDSAIVLIKTAYEEMPHKTDWHMMLTRVYAWDKNYPEAERHAQSILTENPLNREVLLVLSDIYLWSQNWSALDSNTQKAFATFDPNVDTALDSADVIQRYASGLIEQKRYEAARDALNPVKNELPKLWEWVKLRLMTNTVSLTYSYFDFQNQNTDWHTAALEYTKTLRGMTVIGSLNYADRFGSAGNQYMLQAYPILGKKMYAWLIAGFSDGKAFPNGAYGLSLFRSVKKYWEPELGIRIFTVEKNAEKSMVLRGGLSYHRGQNRFNYLASRITGTATDGWAHNSYYRRYWKDEQSYVQLSVGTGANAPSAISPQFDNFLINSFTTSLSTVYWFNNHWRGSAGISWEQSQKTLITETPRSRLIYSIGLAYRF